MLGGGGSWRCTLSVVAVFYFMVLRKTPQLRFIWGTESGRAANIFLTHLKEEEQGLGDKDDFIKAESSWSSSLGLCGIWM